MSGSDDRSITESLPRLQRGQRVVRQDQEMRVSGINHVTLAVDDVETSTAFYTDVLGCHLIAYWPKGAYLLAGGVWVALVLGRHDREHAEDYSHLAFDVMPAEFQAMAAAIGAAGCEVWQDNWTEGESLYFRDPSGHKMEIHATTLLDRLRSAESAPWDGLVIASRARHLLAAAPTIRDTLKPRRFSCLPIGVCVLVYNDQDEVLLLRRPSTQDWECPSGAVEAEESLDEAARRELREEVGDVQVGPLLTVHAYTVAYDTFLPPLVSITYAARYQGGTIVPGDDMVGADVIWAPLSEIGSRRAVRVPTETSLITRGADLLKS